MCHHIRRQKTRAELLAAQRWLDRLVAHTYRFSNVLYESILKNEERKFKNGC